MEKKKGESVKKFLLEIPEEIGINGKIQSLVLYH